MPSCEGMVTSLTPKAMRRRQKKIRLNGGPFADPTNAYENDNSHPTVIHVLAAIPRSARPMMKTHCGHTAFPFVRAVAVVDYRRSSSSSSSAAGGGAASPTTLA